MQNFKRVAKTTKVFEGLSLIGDDSNKLL